MEATRAVSVSRTIIFFFFFYAFLPLRAQAFSSGTLPVRAVASMRRTEALASVKFYQMLSIFFFLFSFSRLRRSCYPLGVFRLGCSFFLATALPVEEFVVTIAAIKETEESRIKFVLFPERSSSKHKFTLVAMISLFCSKRYFAKILFGSFFQMENLIFFFFLLVPAK